MPATGGANFSRRDVVMTAAKGLVAGFQKRKGFGRFGWVWVGWGWVGLVLWIWF